MTSAAHAARGDLVSAAARSRLSASKSELRLPRGGGGQGG